MHQCTGQHAELQLRHEDPRRETQHRLVLHADRPLPPVRGREVQDRLRLRPRGQRHYREHLQHRKLRGDASRYLKLHISPLLAPLQRAGCVDAYTLVWIGYYSPGGVVNPIKCLDGTYAKVAGSTTCTMCKKPPIPVNPSWPGLPLPDDHACPINHYLNSRVKETDCDTVTGWKTPADNVAFSSADCVPCDQCTPGSNTDVNGHSILDSMEVSAAHSNAPLWQLFI